MRTIVGIAFILSGILVSLTQLQNNGHAHRDGVEQPNL